MCKKFKSGPKVIGGKAMCTAYANGIPKKIFFEAGKCSKFLLDNGAKKTFNPRVAKLKEMVIKRSKTKK